MLGQHHQISTAEFEVVFVPFHQLPHAIQELQKDRAALVVLSIALVLAMCTSQREGVTKRAELLLNEDLEAIKSAIERVHQQLCQCAHLQHNPRFLLFFSIVYKVMK
jgi:hypothetical protein